MRDIQSQKERMRRAAATLGIEIPQAGITTEELLTRILEILAKKDKEA